MRNLQCKILILIVVLLMLLSAPVSAANPENAPVNPGRPGNQDAINQGVAKQLSSIDRGLDQVESAFTSLTQIVYQYFGLAEEPPEEPLEEEVVESGEDTEENNDNGVVEDDAKENGQDETDENGTDAVEEEADENGTDAVEEEADENGTDAVEEEADENGTDAVEEDIEGEIRDNRSMSFFGRLGALDNRLNAVERRLDNITATNEDLQQEVGLRRERSMQLSSEVDALRQRIRQVQGVARNLVDQPETVDKGEHENVEPTHKWTITFSRDVNPETVTASNIIVSQIVEGELEVMEVVIMPGENANEIIVNATEGFLPGEAYYLVLTSGVQSAEGVNLASPVQMRFNVK